MIKKAFLLLLIQLLFLTKSANSQTNPTAQNLPYTQNFGTTTFSVMPAGMASWIVNSSPIGSQSNAETSTTNGDGGIIATNTIQTTGGVYGYSTSSNGRLYIQSSSNATNGTSQLALAINTTGKTNIKVSYDIEMISALPRTVGKELQYRVGTSSSWTNVSSSVYSHNSTDRSNGDIDHFTNLTLPSGAENQSVVQLRWVTWRGSESGNSSGLAVDNISITSGPILSVNSATICKGSSTTLTVSGATTYTWSPSTGLNTTTGASVTASPTTTTVYTVTGTSGTSTATASSTVTVNALPTIAITPTAPVICSGSNTNITASGASTYAWNPTTGLSASTGSVVTANPSSTSNYTVTGTDANGCVNIKSFSVTVNSLPTVTVAATNTAICTGANTSLTAGGATTYSWTPSTGLSATTGTNVTASPTVTMTYSVTGTSSLGCIATKTISITVNTAPSLIVSGTQTICAGSTTTLTASGASTYSWSTAATTASVVLSPTATTSYTVTGTSSAGCVASLTSTVNVNSAPSLTVSGSQNIYPGQTTTLTVSGASTYSWNTGATTAVVALSPTTTTVYTVTGTTSGCSSSVTTTITVSEISVSCSQLTYTQNFNSYAGSSASFPTGWLANGTFTYRGTGTGSSTTGGAWAYGTTSGQEDLGALASGTSNDIIYGVYFVNNTGTPITSLAISFNFDQWRVEASGNTNGFKVAGLGALNTSSINTFLDGNLSTNSCISSCGTMPKTTVKTYTLTGLSIAAGATYGLSWEDVDGSGSDNPIGIDDFSITASSGSNISISGTQTICAGQTTTLTASGASTYTWSNGATTAAVALSPTTTTVYTVTGTNSFGCATSQTVAVTVNPAVTITTSFNPNDTILVTNTTTITASGASTYTWYPAIGLSATSGATVTASPTTTTTYTLAGTSAAGCVGTSTFTIYLIQEYYFRSIASGNWNQLSTWQASPDSVTWIAATILPSASSKSVVIQNTHTVTITASVTIDETVVNGTLIYGNNAGSTITIGNGTGTDLIINGTYQDIGSISNIWSTGATWSMGATGTLLRTMGTSSDKWRDNYQSGISNIPATANWIIRKTGSDSPTLSSTSAMYYPNLTIENMTGTTWTTSSTSEFTGSSDYPRIKGNLNIGGSGTSGVLFINQNVNVTPILVQGNLTVQSVSTLENDGTGFNVQGNFTVNGSFTGTKNLFFSGANSQTLSGAAFSQITNLNLNKSGGTLTLGSPVIITNTLTLTSGYIVSSSTNLLTLNNGATVIGGSASSFVSGPLQKIGNTAFTFPTGKGTNYQPIAISAPATATDAFTGEYFNIGQTFGTAKDSTIDSLSTCEYWNLNETIGSDSVSITAGWNANSCQTDSAQYMGVGMWNGSMWVSAGNSSSSGNRNMGSVVSFRVLPIGEPIIIIHFDICQLLFNLAAHAGPSRSIASGGSTILGAIPSITGNFLTVSNVHYSWSPSATIVPSTSAIGTGLNAIVTCNPTTTTTYILTATYGSCTASSSVTVTLASTHHPIQLPYVYLKRELDGGFFDLTTTRNPSDFGYLYFKYDEEYTDNGNGLTYSIYDRDRNVITSPAISTVNYKDNRYSINVGSGGLGLTPSTSTNEHFYVMEVLDKKGQKFYLRFKY
jgi:hypothetical protein